MPWPILLVQARPQRSYSGNPGIHKIAPILSANSSLLSDYSLLAEAAEGKCDLTVVGSETHLENGIQDAFLARGFCFF